MTCNYKKEIRLRTQLDIFDPIPDHDHGIEENPKYLTSQLITYLGNKRSLLDFIGHGIVHAQRRLDSKKIKTFDVFSGSGVVARYMKQFSSLVIANDLEKYSYICNCCYLTNVSEFDFEQYNSLYQELQMRIESGGLIEGLIRQMYAPIDESKISGDDRVFYTVRNAMYIDTVRKFVNDIPDKMRAYFLAPLLAEASIHSNTSGVFKGFYKNSETGIGQFGGTQKNALKRILGKIELQQPILSNFFCDYVCYNQDANKLVKEIQEVDLAYIDPPYNQHPYGSNYFMLNLIIDYSKPEEVSKVSGIPRNWNKSLYNNKHSAYPTFKQLIEDINAKFVIVSFNSEGYISSHDMKQLLSKLGTVMVLEVKYNTFRGCRNLQNRDVHVKEYLYLLEKK